MGLSGFEYTGIAFFIAFLFMYIVHMVYFRKLGKILKVKNPKVYKTEIDPLSWALIGETWMRDFKLYEIYRLEKRLIKSKNKEISNAAQIAFRIYLYSWRFLLLSIIIFVIQKIY